MHFHEEYDESVDFISFAPMLTWKSIRNVAESHHKTNVGIIRKAGPH